MALTLIAPICIDTDAISTSLIHTLILVNTSCTIKFIAYITFTIVAWHLIDTGSMRSTRPVITTLIDIFTFIGQRIQSVSIVTIGTDTFCLISFKKLFTKKCVMSVVSKICSEM